MFICITDQWTIFPFNKTKKENIEICLFRGGAKLHKVQLEERPPPSIFFSHLSEVWSSFEVFARKNLFATSARIAAPLPCWRNLSIDGLTALACLYPRCILATLSTISLFVVWLFFLIPSSTSRTRSFSCFRPLSAEYCLTYGHSYVIVLSLFRPLTSIVVIFICSLLLLFVSFLPTLFIVFFKLSSKFLTYLFFLSHFMIFVKFFFIFSFLLLFIFQFIIHIILCTYKYNI